MEPKDLSYSLSIHSQYDQKKIIDELKSISNSFNQIIGQPQNQNSYQQVAMNNLNRHSNTLNPNDAKVINSRVNGRATSVIKQTCVCAREKGNSYHRVS